MRVQSVSGAKAMRLFTVSVPRSGMPLSQEPHLLCTAIDGSLARGRAPGLKAPSDRPTGRARFDKHASRDAAPSALLLRGLGCENLDAEAAETDVVAARRGEQPDRGNAEVLENLRAKAD